MFELPTVQNSKRIRTTRKLRYQYINALHREHAKLQGQLNPGIALPTPENSAAEESSDADAQRASSIVRKRRKRRLLGVLGCADSDSELSDLEPQNGGYLDAETGSHYDSEKEFFSRHEKPQESFELWKTDQHLATPIVSRTISYADCRQIEKNAHRRTMAKNTHIPRTTQFQYSAMRNGSEVYIPPSPAYHSIHYRQLSELLQTSILHRKWENAYRCFSILIRLPGVDIRGLWGAGAAILDALSPSTKDIGSTTDFLGWLSSIYTSRSNFNQSMNLSLDPVFRSGSKTHSAKFVITWLWESLFEACSDGNPSSNNSYDGINSRLPKLMEKISEMVLTPPYMEDPEVWFIYALCYLVCADQLSDRFSSQNDAFSGLEKDIARNQVTQNITNAHNCLKNCLDKGDCFKFPHRFLQEQLSAFEKRLYGTTSDSRPSEETKSFENSSSEPSASDLDTQEFPVPELSSIFNEEEEDFFGRSERVHFGFDSEESSS
ncbi:LAFA_0F02520g1_1 [Lachancea sp. 'fantastica']|nr:LAFA_0F02520g1_1 [Lachancea sp. 'fantastica']